MSDLEQLLERVRAAKRADRKIDATVYDALVDDGGRKSFRVTNWATLPGARLHAKYHDGWLVGKSSDDHWAEDLPCYTASIDAALALVNKVLPGWCWRIGTCCVSDDAWLAPDWNSPVHGPRLRQELGEPVRGSVLDEGIDVDRRPPGNVPLAIIEALLEALIAKRKNALAQTAPPLMAAGESEKVSN
jgi:hypothetical protein